MKKIYVCSRLSGDIEENIEKAKKYCKYVVKVRGADSSSKFLAATLTHIYFTQFLNDNLPEERTFGTLAGLQLLSECDELWYFGEQISQGMITEIIAAKEQGIPVRYISQKDIDKNKNNGGKNNEN